MASKNVSRRKAVQQILLSAAGITAAASVTKAATSFNMEHRLKGNIHHSVCAWTMGFLSLEELCIVVKEMGINTIDLIAPDGWPVLKKHGVHCSMCYTNGKISLTEGWNKPANHEQLIHYFTEAIPLVAAAGYKNLICFSGNRNGMDDATGLQNCADGLKKILPLAEKNGVVIQMELFNSKIDHKDYMCDSSKWGIELCKKLGSENFKLLYDIYRMQVNEGDIIRTIKQYHPYFGHYHTAGVPGRNEINDTQELYYPAIMKAIYDTGYKGYVAQEFMSKGKNNADKINSLKEAITICDI